MKDSNTTPQSILFRWIVVTLCFVGILLATIKGVSTNNRFILLGLLALPVAVFLVNRLNVWFVTILGLFYTWIYIPGFPTSLSLFHLMAAGMIPVLLAARLLRHGHHDADRATFLRWCGYGYFAVLLITIYFRGFGLRLTGNETWGGAGYIQLIVTILFFLLCDTIVLTERQWKVAIILFFMGGLVPSTAELVFLLSKGSVQFFYWFVRPEGASAVLNLASIQTGGSMVRFQVSKYIVFIFVMCLALYPFRGRHRMAIIASCCLAFVFAGISGHRIAMLYLLLLIPTVMYFTNRRLPVRLLMGYGVVLGAAIIFLHLFGRALPISVQRSVSWVPFADISSVAIQSAMETTTWRIELWKRLMEFLPDNWLLGRGFAYSSAAYYSLRYLPGSSIEWAIVTHNYHNGPLSLLIDLGLFGLLFGSGLMIGGIIRHVRLLKRDWVSPKLARYHRVVLAALCVDVVIFYAIHGDASMSIVGVLIQLAILEGLWRTDGVLRMEAAIPVPDRPSTQPSPVSARIPIAGRPAWTPQRGPTSWRSVSPL